MRLASRGGYDYTERFPTAHKRPHKRLVIDGEAVLLAFHGISDLDGLRSEQAG